MSASFASRIQQARQQLARRRDEIRQDHARGASSLQVVAALTALVDSVSVSLIRAAVESRGPDAAGEFVHNMAVVAVGGYGRLELAPFSDVDLLFLYQPASKSVADGICQQLVCDFWDAGLALGW